MDTAPQAPFQTRAELLAWLEQQGLSHVARLGLEAVAPRLDPLLRPLLKGPSARRRLIDLASADSLTRSLEWLPSPRLREVLPPLVWDYLKDEQAQAALARSGVAERLRPPDEPRARPLHARLCQLRAGVPARVAPSVPGSRPGALQVDTSLPGFRLEDPRPYEPLRPTVGSFLKAEARLSVAPGAVSAECSCGATDCIHVLAALDEALFWLNRLPTEDFLEVLQELDRPAWERSLLALDRALDEEPLQRIGIEVYWRLEVTEDEGVEVVPWVHRLGKKGQPGPGTAYSRRKLLHEHGPRLSPGDLRAASLLPEGPGPASRALLEALIDHPRLVRANAPDRHLRIERVEVGLVAEERQGAVRVTAGVEGTALSPDLLERLRKPRPEEVLFLWDGTLLTLLEVKPELQSLLGVLHRVGDVFPPESRASLVATLSRWAQKVPVVMPRSIMGEAVPAQLQLVLRLQAHPNGAVDVEVRVRTLPDAQAQLPGDGPKDVHVRRGEKAVHAVRDLKQEVAAAEALCAALPLSGAERLERPFSYSFPDPRGALEVLAACAAREQPPELEWVGKPLRSVQASSTRALKVSLQRKRDWFGVLGELTVGGERVELARLLDAARRKDRHVQLSSHTYLELGETLRQQLERLADHVHTTRHGLEVGPAATEALLSLEAAGAGLEADPAWRKLVERLHAARKREPRLPEGLRADLRPYQAEGFRWLSRLAAWGAGGVLADDMGLGKTVQALALLLERSPQGPALVVAPTSVAFNWRDETRRFAPSLRLTVLADVEDRAQAVACLGPGDVLVVSYGLLVREAERLASRPFATLVLDEAQELKNMSTQRFRAARMLQAEARVALSGTPLENHLGELWSLFAVVFPGLLGSWESFRVRYAVPIERKTDPTAAPALGRVLAPFLLRRTKALVEAELPARTEVRVPVVLSTAEWALYEDARLAALSELETPTAKLKEQDRRVEVLAALTRLRLLASHPRLYDPRSRVASSKLLRLLELVEELRAEGQRALVFSQFTSHLALVREALEARGIRYVYLDGQTPRKERGERVREFQEGDAPLFLLSLKAGGVGLNLTAATNVIQLDPWWNPAVEDQAADRAHRLGQTRPVTLYRLVAMGTIEEEILSLHRLKRSLVEQVLSGKAGASKVTTEELLALLAQGPERGQTDEGSPARSPGS